MIHESMGSAIGAKDQSEFELNFLRNILTFRIMLARFKKQSCKAL